MHFRKKKDFYFTYLPVAPTSPDASLGLLLLSYCWSFFTRENTVDYDHANKKSTNDNRTILCTALPTRYRLLATRILLLFRRKVTRKLFARHSEINQIINHKEDGKTIYIFVKKNDSEGSQHYYLGEAEYMKGSANETTNVTEDKIVTMNFIMKTPIRDDIYRYLVN